MPRFGRRRRRSTRYWRWRGTRSRSEERPHRVHLTWTLGPLGQGKEASLTTLEDNTQALLGAIERRLIEISAQQHALAVEKARLMEHRTPLRLGIVAANTVVVQLKAKGVMLRGLSAAGPAAQVPRPPMLKAIASLRPAMRLAR